MVASQANDFPAYLEESYLGITGYGITSDINDNFPLEV